MHRIHLSCRSSYPKTPFDRNQWIERQQNLRDNWIQAQRQSLHFKDPQATSKLNSGNPGYMHTSKYAALLMNTRTHTSHEDMSRAWLRISHRTRTGSGRARLRR